jgi:F-type H+-transporting ATPase subunit epsilon
MLTVSIITPERALPPQQASHITMTTVDGEVGIRTGHAPLVAGMKTGFAMIRDAQGKETWLAVKGGTGLVLRDEVKLYVEAAMNAESVDLDQVQKRLDALGHAQPKTDLERQRNQEEATWQLMLLSVAQKRLSESGSHAASGHAKAH